MTFSLPPLPFDRGALAPALSAESFDYHHGKHHKAYVETANELLEAHGALQGKSLEEVIRAAAADPALVKLYNNAAQHWNHCLFWQSLSPPGSTRPGAALQPLLRASFGGLDGFKQAFVKAATDQFGSGWTWLIKDGDGLAIRTTGNADLPLTDGQRALAVCDVWEHAYYLDHRNARPAFVEAFVDTLLDWTTVERRLAGAPVTMDQEADGGHEALDGPKSRLFAGRRPG